MIVFEDIQDVQEWLEPLALDAFWDAVAPWSVFSGDERAHYEQVLVDGEVCAEKVLFCLKNMARVELQMRFDLRDRTYEPPDAKYLRSRH